MPWLRTIFTVICLAASLNLAADESERLEILDQEVPVAESSGDEAVGPEPVEEAVPLAEQLAEEYERYRSLHESGLFVEAGDAAKRVVEMSIRHNGPKSLDTAKALVNLAIVQHETEDFEAAVQNYQTAIEVIQDSEDNLSPVLINPLKGLGRTQMAAGRPDQAIGTYGRAVHLSHVNDGPHNLDQINMLEAMAEANLQLGDVEEAKNAQDMVYSLNLRHHSGNPIDIVPSLMKRAFWQRRTGYVIDERATLRRAIRIVEDQNGKNDLGLVEPLTRLGESYYFVDVSESSTYQAAGVTSGELYFKRAVRVAENNPDADWQLVAATKLKLSDYYNYTNDQGRARKTYREVWEYLSEDDARAEFRHNNLQDLNIINEDPLPQYVDGASRADRIAKNPELREGRILVSFKINLRGRVNDLEVVEEAPIVHEEMRRALLRELRTRVYRLRLVDGNPVESPGQLYTHTYYYLQSAMQEDANAEDGETSD